MTETLSTMIAFVGFLILLSMIVQTFQEALKNLLKLKTGVWERFFHTLYRKEFDTGGATSMAGGVRTALAALKKRAGSGEFVGEFEKRLTRIREIVGRANDLLKTITQSITAVRAVDPNAPDAGRRLLAAIEPLNESLAEIAGLRVHTLLEIYDSLQQKRLVIFQNEVVKFINAQSGITEEIARLGRQQMSQKVVDVQAAAEALQKEIDKVSGMLRDYRIQIENKLDAWLAQLNEEYRRNMLLWTVIIGTAMVAIFNADSFEIYRYLSTNPSAQAGVVQAVAGMKDAKYVTDAADLNSAETQLREGKTTEAKASLMRTAKNLKEDFSMVDDKERGAAVAALEERLQEVQQKDKEASLQQLKFISGELSLLYLSFQKAVVDHHIERLAYLDLPLGWADYVRDFTASTSGWIRLIFRKLGGLLLTSFLITFGAPFWNDVLNAIVGLKNIGAKK